MRRQILFSAILACFMSFANAQWQQTSLDSGQINCLTVNGADIFAGTEGNGIYLSNNNGGDWAQMNNGLSGQYVQALAFNGNYFFAGTRYGTGIFLSTDKGINWTEANNGYGGTCKTCVLAIVASDTNVFVGSMGGNVYMSGNNGASWEIRGGVLSFYGVSSIAISEKNIFAGTWGNGIFLTDNNGANWTEVDTGLTDKYVHTLVVSGTNIFAGTDDGVFLSTNNGANWTEVNTGLTNKYVHTLAVSGANIFAGTYGGGVFLSGDNGTSWVAVNDGLTDLKVVSFAVMGEYIYIGTATSGVWKRPLSDFAGINEINENNSITVYPNPAINNIKIESSKKSTIEILNIQGQTVLQQQMQQGETDIDISVLAKGIYILRLNSNDKTEVTRIVKE